jgi:glutathione S-transferase
MQDSTPIIEKTESAVPDPTVYPNDPVTRFVSDLLEEFGDEWGNKWMFHMRWWKEIDAVAVSRRFAARSGGDLETTAASIRERMVPRVWFVGGNEITAPQIKQSLDDALGHLEPHLGVRSYILGERPSMADFGLWGQIYNAGRDPTAGTMIAKNPNVQAWIERMLNPDVKGDFESWDSLAPTLVPLIKDQVGSLFLPWSVANSVANENGDDDFTLELKGNTWTQKPQKYHARSLGVLRQKYRAVADNDTLNEILNATACLQYLA